MLITIGSFDGFHKGHAELLRICRENASNNDWGVVTFYPHPSEFLHNLKHPLFTLRERELVSKFLGIPKMYVLEFNDELKNLSPEEFWALLRKKFNVDGLVMGSDFHFGLNRSGNAEMLSELAKSDGVNKIFIAELVDKKIYSSSNVRSKILAGDVEGAREILGYNWFMISDVIHGTERGRTMKFPTANLNLSGNKIIPAYGVYASALLANHEWHCGALSIGNNPTFHDINETRAEVHILDFNGDLYGDEVLLAMLGRVREIRTFADKAELMKQIANDLNSCRKIYDEAVDDKETGKFLRSIKEISKINIQLFSREKIKSC